MARAIEQLKQSMEACELGALTLPDQIDALMDAARAILQEVSTLTPANEWVSVEERLPEESDGMVLLTDGISVRTGYRNWMFRMDDYPIVFVPGQKKGGGEMAVTHWMKISAPPDRRPPEGEEDTP